MQMFALIKGALCLFSEIFVMVAAEKLPFHTEHPGHSSLLSEQALQADFNTLFLPL